MMVKTGKFQKGEVFSLNKIMRTLGVLIVLALVGEYAFGQEYVPLRANFTYSPDYALLNDRDDLVGGFTYVDAGRGNKGNPYIGFEAAYGQFNLWVSSSAPGAGRFVQVLLGEPVEDAPIYVRRSYCYPNRFPDTSVIRKNLFRSMSEYILQEDGTWVQTGQALNIRDMQVGDTRYCFLTIRFEVQGDKNFYLLGGLEPATPVQVTVEDGPVWVFKPVPGYENRKLLRNGTCDEGVYRVDFELRVALK